LNKRQAIEDLKETYPTMVGITNFWLQLAINHGYGQDKAEKECLLKFANAMKFITGKTDHSFGSGVKE